MFSLSSLFFSPHSISFHAFTPLRASYFFFTLGIGGATALSWFFAGATGRRGRRERGKEKGTAFPWRFGTLLRTGDGPSCSAPSFKTVLVTMCLETLLLRNLHNFY